MVLNSALRIAVEDHTWHDTATFICEDCGREARLTEDAFDNKLTEYLAAENIPDPGAGNKAEIIDIVAGEFQLCLGCCTGQYHVGEYTTEDLYDTDNRF